MSDNVTNELALPEMRALLSIVDVAESNVERRIAAVFEALGYDVETSYPTGDGPCDVYLANRRVVVEVKAPGKADPSAVRARSDGSNETQFEQIVRYVVADHRRERDTLGFETDSPPWVGLLTDGRSWWRWEFKLDSDGGLVLLSVASAVQRSWGTERDAVQALEWLVEATRRTVGLRWVPNDPTKELVAPKLVDLENLYDQVGSSPATKTKRRLWLEMLQASGSAPDSEADQLRLFHRHTLLVLVARCVVLVLADKQSYDEECRERATDGFVSWLVDVDPDTGEPNQTGDALVRRVFEDVASYDWRRRGRDVLRTVYESLIDAEDRKAFGEFYTPDWLAEAVVNETLDDAWLTRLFTRYEAHHRRIPDGCGALDPACGSGTFLFHAVKRIINCAQERCEPYEPAQLADLCAAAVCGVDIHPVAVELARATMLRAMPAMPSGGTNALRVYQGDSLLWNRSVGFGNALADDDVPARVRQSALALDDVKGFAVSNGERAMLLPLSFVKDQHFTANINELVGRAYRRAHSVDASQPPTLNDLPTSCHARLSVADKASVLEAFATLVDVIAADGNGVWAWYFRNAAAPLGLYWRKVDRIVANPPWVRMSHIQTEERKRELETLADHLDVWGKGKTNTSLDVAGLFVARCQDLYLADDPDSASGWVLPWAALNGKNWLPYRQLDAAPQSQRRGRVSREWDLSQVKQRPFTGAHACVWLVDKHAASQPQRYVLENTGRTRAHPASSWSDVADTTKWVKHAARFSSAASPYAVTRGGKHAFRQSATLVPYVLVKAATFKPSSTPGRSDVTTVAPSETGSSPWSVVPSQSGSVPNEMLRAVVTSHELLPFSTRTQLATFVLPLDATGEGWMDDDALRRVHMWRKAENHYETNRGAGKSTPKTLMAQLNFNNKLIAQTQLKRRTKKVIYNKSGQLLRATRAPVTALVSDQCYWYQPVSASEAKFLVAMLNAPSLQEVFRQARGSDRDFHHTPWDHVPIPLYDATNTDHAKLVDLCARAEKVATRVVTQQVQSGHGQKKASNLIRGALAADGVLDLIDVVVRRLLPNHAT